MDKKLTDAEIVKALECCIELFYENNVRCDQTIEGLADDVKSIFADLINRQKEEKEVLEARIGIYETCNARKDEAIKHLEAENERLKAKCENTQVGYNFAKEETKQWKEEANRYQNLWCETVTDIQTAKAEAYKEFAERLKENSIATFSWKGVVMVGEIDNLLKELVGE